MAPPTLEPAFQADVRARNGDRVDNQDCDICRVGVDALSSVISIRAPVQPQDFGTDVPMRVWKSKGRRRHMIEAVMCYVDAENRGWHSVCRFCT
jgi:hypothetical protein